LSDILQEFGLAIIKLLVVMDPIAVLPLITPLLISVEKPVRRRVIRNSLATALIVGLVFLGLGELIFVALDISISNFLVAGGLVLLVLALREIAAPGTAEAPEPDEMMAAVPIGTPLLVGPATVSMLIVLTEQQNTLIVLAAFLVNIAIAFLVFVYGGRIISFMGKGGLKAFSRVAYLLLAAIAIQMIAEGLPELIP
jgi:multiple antibiotic resistance protein